MHRLLTSSSRVGTAAATAVAAAAAAAAAASSAGSPTSCGSETPHEVALYLTEASRESLKKHIEKLEPGRPSYDRRFDCQSLYELVILSV